MAKYKILPRSTWTSTGFGFSRLKHRLLDKSKVRTLVPHYPAAGNVWYSNPTLAESCQRLRNWRDMHVNRNGWVDIGYPFAIDQAGRIFTCAGASFAAAHAGKNNFVSLGCLFIVGDNETPTPEARAAFRWLGKWLRENFGMDNLTQVMDHGRLPGEYTSCAGTPIRAQVNVGNMSITGSGSDLPAPKKPTKKWVSQPMSHDAVAKEIVNEKGNWGNGAERKRRLEANGFVYNSVQRRVNALIAGKRVSSSRKSSARVAQDIANGKGNWGNNPQRAQKLRAAGYSPAKIQGQVNRILSGRPSSNKKTSTQVARDIINGKGGWGNEPERSRKLRAAEYNPATVQRRINQLL